MALADKTRLRLLNLMRSEEVCVCFFTEVLGESQPKISRHLAYLRNAGLVHARRDGKWMHYSIVEPEDGGGKKVLEQALIWLDAQPELRAERERYKAVCCSPELLVQIARTPMNFVLPPVEIAEPAKEVDSRQPAFADRGYNEIEEFLL